MFVFATIMIIAKTGPSGFESRSSSVLTNSLICNNEIAFNSTYTNIKPQMQLLLFLVKFQNSFKRDLFNFSYEITVSPNDNPPMLTKVGRFANQRISADTQASEDFILFVDSIINYNAIAFKGKLEGDLPTDGFFVVELRYVNPTFTAFVIAVRFTLFITVAGTLVWRVWQMGRNISLPRKLGIVLAVFLIVSNCHVLVNLHFHPHRWIMISDIVFTKATTCFSMFMMIAMIASLRSDYKLGKYVIVMIIFFVHQVGQQICEFNKCVETYSQFLVSKKLSFSWMLVIRWICFIAICGFEAKNTHRNLERGNRYIFWETIGVISYIITLQTFLSIVTKSYKMLVILPIVTSHYYYWMLSSVYKPENDVPLEPGVGEDTLDIDEDQLQNDDLLVNL